MDSQVLLGTEPVDGLDGEGAGVEQLVVIRGHEAIDALLDHFVPGLPVGDFEIVSGNVLQQRQGGNTGATEQSPQSRLQLADAVDAGAG